MFLIQNTIYHIVMHVRVDTLKDKVIELKIKY